MLFRSGWYRKTFIADKVDEGKRYRIDFDGVYMNSTVYINGHELGTRPYGYISFSYDLTPYIKWGEKNVIAVRVDNAEQPNSRWYSGCGIYRNVWLTKLMRELSRLKSVIVSESVFGIMVI